MGLFQSEFQVTSELKTASMPLARMTMYFPPKSGHFESESEEEKKKKEMTGFHKSARKE